jgi:hypothetical protein
MTSERLLWSSLGLAVLVILVSAFTANGFLLSLLLPLFVSYAIASDHIQNGSE